MNTKKLITLAVILVVAVGIILLVNTLSNPKPSEEALRFFPGVTEKTIGAVLLKNSGDTVKLQRKGDVWVAVPKQALGSAQAPSPSGLSRAIGDTGASAATVKPPAGLAAADFPADSGLIAQLIENIVNLKKNTLVSENPANQVKYEVDAAHGTSIEVFDGAGKSLGIVKLGKNAESYNANYFRSEKSNAVYLVLESSRWVFDADHKRWTNKSIMKFDKALVQRLTIAKKGAPAIVVARGDSASKGAWQMVGPAVKRKAGEALDSNKVNEIVNTLADFRVADYEESALSDSATGLADPSIVVSVNFKSGTVRTLVIGNKNTTAGQNRYWVRVPEKMYVYLIESSEQQRFNKKTEDFMVQPGKPAPVNNGPKLKAQFAPEKYKKAVEEFKKKNKK